MTKVYHLNCVDISAPTGDHAIGHCLVLETADRLVLIDTGLGEIDYTHGEGRLGVELIQMVGFNLDVEASAIRQIKALGLNPELVTDCVISHMDCDHIGGLIDFPQAKLHLGQEEFLNYQSDNPRYLRNLLSHNPVYVVYPPSSQFLFGLEVRALLIEENLQLYLTPLFGHTEGHCGVLFCVEGQWYLYVADAYYLRAELSDDAHPIHELTEARADNNVLRIKTLDKIRTFIQQHPEVCVFSYHDPLEFSYFVNQK